VERPTQRCGVGDQGAETQVLAPLEPGHRQLADAKGGCNLALSSTSWYRRSRMSWLSFSGSQLGDMVGSHFGVVFEISPLRD
jgi:hypothetical protein